MRIDDLLDGSLWIHGLTKEEQEVVRKEMIVKVIPADGFVCHRGETSDYWFGLISGLVKMNNVSLTGKAVTLLGIPAGVWFGEGSLLKNEPRKYDVVALRQSELALLPKAVFNWLLENNLSFNRYLIDLLNNRLGQFIAAVENERLLDVEARVARSLASMFETQLSPKINQTLQISQEELGHLAGVSRQRANAALKILEENGLLTVNYGEIKILDLDGLKDF